MDESISKNKMGNLYAKEPVSDISEGFSKLEITERGCDIPSLTVFTFS
jgi:hypothetical protein